MKEIWHRDKAEFHGEFVNFDPIYSWTKPVQRPHPPVCIGGGEKAFARVVEVGDGWFPNPQSSDGLKPKIERLREFAGREVPVTVLHVGAAEAEIVNGYGQAGVERIVFPLDTEATDPLADLDELVALAVDLAVDLDSSLIPGTSEREA